MSRIVAALFSIILMGAQLAAAPRIPKFRHIPAPRHQAAAPVDSLTLYRDSIAIIADSLFQKTLSSVDSLRSPEMPDVNRSLTPRVFAGYRSVHNPSFRPPQTIPAPSIGFPATRYEMPAWLRHSMQIHRMQEDFAYINMLRDYTSIEYAYWDLPVPPRLPEEDYSFNGYLKRLKIDVDKPVITPDKDNIDKIHWLHIFNPGIQFSQAYVSANWYQGGSPSISLLFNFLWDVSLNQVYHPNLMFSSTFSYKLGLTSLSNNDLHKYIISDDILQYNLRTGVKAFKNWFYSFTLQFKTQLFNNYPADSDVRSASFLSPGDLNMGIGMTFSKENDKKTIKFNASLAPVSYNLKTCIDPIIDHAQFNISPGRKTHTEIGSNAEITFNAKISQNISYDTRLFLFTSYREFQGDWQNTLSFRINSFLSTQIYAHLRYDTSSDISDPRWRHWMLKELFTFGLSYYFSTTGKKKS